MKCNKYETKSGKEIRLWQGDCMELMQKNKKWDLAIVDPPYGLGKRTTDGGGTNSQIKFMDDIRRTDWDDNKPDKKYFKKLYKKSNNQIIWGGNYFDLPPTRTIVCWEKMVAIQTMSQIEMAWTSFDSPARIVKINNTNPDRFHPTQKPIKLYRWLLNNYAEEGDTILDTHGGSMSLAIACYMEDYELDIIELDKDYYNDAVQRFEQHISQKTLF